MKIRFWHILNEGNSSKLMNTDEKLLNSAEGSGARVTHWDRKQASCLNQVEPTNPLKFTVAHRVMHAFHRLQTHAAWPTIWKLLADAASYSDNLLSF